MSKLKVSWKENGIMFIDILEIGKDCTQDQANQLIDMGIATKIKEEGIE